MNNTKVLEEFLRSEEKNTTELKMKLDNKIESEQKDSMINTKTVNEYENWKTITDPKLRKKMRKKAYYEKNKEEINTKNKIWSDNNKEKRKITNKIWYKKNKEEILKRMKVTGKVYRENNKDLFKKYYEVNKENVLSKKKIYNELNKDKIKKQKQEYYQRNKVKILDYNKSYHKNKLKSNTQYRLAYILRCRLRTALNKKYKAGHAVKDLGCSIEELKSYLESKFLPGMTWDNHTQNGWHIDHIKPLSMFDLTDRVQFLQACHYTNLQPLWAHDNLTKSDKYYEDHRLINGQSVAQASQVKHSPL